MGKDSVHEAFGNAESPAVQPQCTVVVKSGVSSTPRPGRGVLDDTLVEQRRKGPDRWAGRPEICPAQLLLGVPLLSLEIY